MSRGKPCTICTSPQRGQIDALIATGIRLKDIVAQIPVTSPYALSRHKRNCLTPASAPPTRVGDSLDAQLAVWLQRSEDLYHAGGAGLDLRAQAQAITSAFRALEVARKNEERQEQAARDLPHDLNQWTEEEAVKFRVWLDSIIRDADVKMTQRVE